MFNALTFDKDILNRAGSKNCSRVFYVGNQQINDGRVTCFVPIDDNSDIINGNMYLKSLLIDERVIDRVIEHYLTNKPMLIINACETLDEVGTCDKRFGRSPIELAHELGLLDGAYVSGATYLDKDDIELIKSDGAEIILTPSYTLGNGFGIPPLRMMLSVGATVHLGSGAREYNTDADLIFESKLISLAVNGALCTKDSIDKNALKKMLN